MFGSFPVYAGIGDRDTVLKLGKIGRDLLITGIDVALQHDAANRFISVDDLSDAVI